MVTALVMLFERQTADAQQQMRTDLVADLVAGRGDRAELTTAARAYGLDPARPFCLLALVGEDAAAAPRTGPLGARRGRVARHRRRARRSGRRPRHGDGRRRAGLVGLGSARTSWLARRSPGSGRWTTSAAVPAAFTEAVRTVRAMVALGHAGTGAAAADLGFAGLVVGSEPDVGDYVRRHPRTPAGLRRRARHRSRRHRRGLLRRRWQPPAHRDHAARARQHRRAAAGTGRGPARCHVAAAGPGARAPARAAAAPPHAPLTPPAVPSSRRSIASTTAAVPFEARRRPCSG